MSSSTSPGSSEPGAPASGLSIVIVSWKVRDLLSDCLRSLAEDGLDRSAQVIVVDNDSGDGTVEMVRSRYPWAELIASPRNLGYSRGNNLALPRARGRYLLVLNPDTVVLPGAIRRLVEFADSHPRCAAVSPRQLGADGGVQKEAAVNLPTLWNTFCDLTLLSKIFPRSRILASRKMGSWSHEDDREVPAVAGSAVLLRREALDQVGPWDASMFYAEDMDLCLRLRNAGWRIAYLGSTAIVHYGGGSTRQTNEPGHYRRIGYQSFWLFLLKHRGRCAAAALALMVGGWSLLTLALLLPLAPLERGAGTLGAALRRRRDIATALVSWSVSDKRRFRHHLADPAEGV
jgi:GT2 family glycosyltransferase